MPHPGVHRHGKGYRGSVTVTTATCATEQDAATALAALKSRIKRIKALRNKSPPPIRQVDPLGGRREPHMIPATSHDP